MKLHQLSQDELLKTLHTGLSGLSEKKARERLEEFGVNQLQKKHQKNWLNIYLSQFLQFFALLLELAAGLAFIAHHFSPDEGNNILAWVILGAVVINASFTFWQEFRADKAMEALLKLMPSYILLLRDGVKVKLDTENLVPGDVIFLEEGNKIPADGILLEASSLYLDMSTLTGESTPVKRELGSGPNERELEAYNTIFAGTTVISGIGKAVIYATGSSTEFGKIATLTRDVKRNLTPMQKEIIHITRVLTMIALAIGFVFYLLGSLTGRGQLTSAIFALSLIVANVPEGLLPTITLSLSLASQRMARRNALVKNLDSVETLGSATVICTDKTGTLTRNEMTLRKVWMPAGETIQFSGEGYFQTGDWQSDSELPDTDKRLKALLMAASLNCRASISASKALGDPTELALLAAANKLKLQPTGYLHRQDYPFSSERKMMSTLYRRGEQEHLFSKGALEVILERCDSLMIEEGLEQPLDSVLRQEIVSRAEQFENQAYRVLAVAQSQQNSESGMCFLGLAAIMDLPRPEISAAIQACYQAGIRIMMLTGDHPRTAHAIAQKIGLKVDQIITGSELRKMPEDALAETLKNQDVLFARMESSQKLLIASVLQNIGEVVAMTGDGVNDAPALRRADIGIAMGKTGTDVTREAADMILLDDNFQSIVAAIEEGRTVYFNIKKFITYILSSNVPEIVPYILQFFLKIPLPLSVIQILTIDLGSDMLPGLALGSERPEKNIMKRPPVSKDEKILDREVFKRGYFMNGLIEGLAAMFGFLAFLFLMGWQYGDLSISGTLLHRQAMTMTLLGAIFCQLLNVWTLRSYEFSAWSMGLFSNRLLWLALGLEGLWIWALLNNPWVQSIFNTASIDWPYLLLLLPFPILLFSIHESYKASIRSRKKKIYSEQPV